MNKIWDINDVEEYVHKRIKYLNDVVDACHSAGVPVEGYRTDIGRLFELYKLLDVLKENTKRS